MNIRRLMFDDRFAIVPSYAVGPVALEEYWGALYQADTLKYRWGDMEDPKPSEIVEYTMKQPHCYNVVDTYTNLIRTDFTLGPFTGKAAQMHFSMRPNMPLKENQYIANAVTDIILYKWKDIKDMGEPFVDSLFALPAVDNRPAIFMIHNAGFKSIGTLASGTNYLNEVADALLTVKTREVK